jgi:cytochrome c oxidase subunit 2
MKRLVLGALLLTEWAGAQQSVLDPAGRQSSQIANLWWLFLWLLGSIFVVVMAVALWALRRKHPGIEQEPVEAKNVPSPDTQVRLNRAVTSATVLSVIILLGLIVVSIATGKSVSSLELTRNGLAIEVTGNQWWWSIRYLNDEPSRIVVTANELHIPVGRPVMIRGTSNDVIHSFWVPELNGKRDLIPSRVTSLWIQADHPGRYRGQCAEFCGLQHAHMALWVVAESPDQFEAWMRHQLEPAVQPSDPIQLSGQRVFLNNACIFCHAIGGTSAAGQVGPDLTHLASRLTLAAGTLPNNKGNLGGWIADPQGIKPGTHMATVPLNAEDVEPLLEYLETLQ